MINKIIAIIIICVFIPVKVFAQTTTSTSGIFSIVKQNEIIKYNGVLFDPTAIAIILADKEQNQKEFQLKLDFELNKQKSDFSK